MNRQNKGRVPRIGDVYCMKFSGSGSEQTGVRPGLVIQNNVGNAHSPNVIAVPLTSVLKKSNQPTHVVVKAEDTGLKVDSMVLCENPECMSKEKIGNYITSLPEHYMKQVAEASLLASSIISYLDVGALILAWKRASALNRAV